MKKIFEFLTITFLLTIFSSSYALAEPADENGYSYTPATSTSASSSASSDNNDCTCDAGIIIGEMQIGDRWCNRNGINSVYECRKVNGACLTFSMECPDSEFCTGDGPNAVCSDAVDLAICSNSDCSGFENQAGCGDGFVAVDTGYYNGCCCEKKCGNEFVEHFTGEECDGPQANVFCAWRAIRTVCNTATCLCQAPGDPGMLASSSEEGTTSSESSSSVPG